MLKSFKELCKYDIAIPEETKTRCRNFIDIMNKFVNIKLKNEEYRLKQLVSFINGNKMIEEKNWLNSMINKNQ
jgi:hypothetical protein